VLDIPLQVWQRVKAGPLWRSLFRHGYPDSRKNQSLAVFTNVFLHLHPVKVRRHALAIPYTWCMGGLSFFLFLVLTLTGTLLMFYYRPTTEWAYSDIKDLETVVIFGQLLRNMHRWAATCLRSRNGLAPRCWLRGPAGVRRVSRPGPLGADARRETRLRSLEVAASLGESRS